MRINNLLLTGIVGISLLISCANEETSVTPSTAEPAVVNLTLSTGTVSSRAGGSGGTDMPTSDGSIENSSANEAKLNRVCIGIFDGNISTSSSSTSNVVTIQEITAPSSTSNTITTTTAAKYIIVVANAQSGWFKGITTLYDFLQKAADLGYTISTDGSSKYDKSTYSSPFSSGVNCQQTTSLPMCSSVQALNNGNSLTANTTTEIAATLTRLVARVAITNITTSFEKTGAYAEAVFTPTEVFMYNANTTYNWDGNAPSTLSLQSGESTNASYALSALTDYSYLSSGLLSLTPTTPTTAYSSTATELSYLVSGKPYYFYVFPNISTSSPTKLIIKGKWTLGTNTSVVYYPIIINHVQTGTTFSSGTTTGSSSLLQGSESQVTANIRYALSATIRSIGVSSVDANIDPASIDLSVTVTKWTDTEQSVVFN